MVEIEEAAAVFSNIPHVTSLRIASYTRISSSRDESTSLTRQREQAQGWATMKGGDLVAEYSDDGMSGAVDPKKRPGLAAALAAAEAGQIDALVVAKLDRLARDVRAFLELADHLASHDVALVSLAENLDMGSAAGRMVATVLAAFATMERERTAERVHESNRYLASVGAISGQTAPYGWQKIRHDDGRLRLILDPDESAILRQVVDAVIAGSDVASARRAADLPRTHTGTMSALRHPILLGRHIYQGQVVNGPDGLPLTPHEPLLDWEEWTALQARLDAQATRRSSSGLGLTDTLLGSTKLAVCGICGGGMVVNRHKGKRKVGYRCGKGGCTSANAAGVDAVVEAEFLAAVGNFEVITLHEVPSENAALLEQARARQIEVSGLVAEGLLPIDAARENLAALATTITTLEAEGTAGQRTTQSTGQTFAEAWAEADMVERRALLGNAIESVVISKAVILNAFDPNRVEVHWNT